MKQYILFTLALLTSISCRLAGKVALIERFSDCESLLVAIKSWASLSSTTLFTVVPDFPEKYSSKSLLYWLDYCDVQDVDIIVLFPSSLPEASPLQQECSYDSYVKFYSIATSISSNIIYHLDDYIKAVYRTNSAMHISYFVGGHYDDAELSSELKQHRVMTAHISTLLNESVNRLQLEYTSLNFALLQKHARNTKVHAIFTSKFHLKTSSVAPLTSDMSLLADGSIYVYIFVCDIHLHLAQHYVHRLKWSCDVKETCHMVLEYHIHSVFCHVTNTDISHAKPSIYGALLELECLLKDNNQDLDYIYLLVGLDALWSFPQPSKPNENSYIPSMEYGKITIMPILSPIVLPALHSNMTAMVGQTMFMSRFLMDIKECLRYYEDDSAHYQICIRELQIALHHIVAFDEDARVFQFNSSYRDIFAASSSEVDALGQLETVDSKHELYENSMLFDTYDLFPYGDFLNESVVDTILQYLEQQHSQSAISQQVIDVVAATVRFEFIDHGEWFSAIYTIWTVVQFILSRKECLEEHIDPLALRLAEVARYSSYANYKTSLDEYKACYYILQHMIHLLRPRSSSGAHSVFPAYSNEDAIFSKLVFASYAAAIAVAYECKDIPTIKRLYGSSQQFLLSAHSSIFDKISGLQATYGGQNTSSMRFVTYATNVTEGLKALLKTAAIAGVSVKILGMGERLRYFGNRIKAYYQYLQSPLLAPTDVVVFIDAYDVLLFSSVRRISRIFDEEIIPASLLVCADGGIYPEKTSSYFYPHGTYQSSADFSYVPRYINGGCVIGKVWALREAYAFLNFYADSIGDDQMLLARHYQLFPSLYHIDSTQILTMTTHKQYRFNIPSNRLVSSLGIAMIVSPDMELILVNETTGAIVKDIGILHGNNMGSSPIYMMANHTFFTYFQMKYQDLNGTEHHAILQSSAGDLHEFTRKAKELRSKKLRDMWSRVDGKQVLV